MGEVVRLQDFRRPEGWVDQKHVAQHFSVTTRTVRSWDRAGMREFASKMVGGVRRYRLGLVEEWHDRRERA